MNADGLNSFARRLQKVQSKRLKMAARLGSDAWRIYDRDIPEHRYLVEWYAAKLRLAFMPSRRERHSVPPYPLKQLAQVCAEALNLDAKDVHPVVRAPKAWGEDQYELQAEPAPRFTVQEGGLQFWVELTAHLDTGLYLDHRTTRARFAKEAAGKRVLNLFCYTGAFSVHAAAAGAKQTLSVDLSNTYLSWAQDNFRLNGLQADRHRFLRSDVLRFVHQCREQFELIVLDPPPYSASKKMEGDFEVQRDQRALLQDTRALLQPGGVLYFSTNYRGFEADPRLFEGFAQVEELTPASIPEDFRDRQIHRCWRCVRT